MSFPRLLTLFSLVLVIGCGDTPEDIGEADGPRTCECVQDLGQTMENDTSDSVSGPPTTQVQGALLTTRFKSLEELKQVVKIEYFSDTTATDSADRVSAKVRLTHCSNGREVVSILESGISEGDIRDARDGDIWDKMGLGLGSPFSLMNRRDLQIAYMMSRRRPNFYGEGDVAFFDLALATVDNINTEEIAFKYPRDSSEKGYLNSFNHITSQAFITSIFSEEMADFIADLHERHHMPELITGQFTPEQLAHPDKNPVDNYVDVINNEWGQELGKQLGKKYGIDRDTYWTTELLTNYLNDLQSYYSWAFQIGFKPFRQDDEVVVRFTEKCNTVLKGVSLKKQ